MGESKPVVRVVLYLEMDRETKFVTLGKIQGELESLEGCESATVKPRYKLHLLTSYLICYTVLIPMTLGEERMKDEVVRWQLKARDIECKHRQ